MTLAIDLSPAELRLLSTLRLNPRRAFRGSIRGERLTRQKGLSIEFADFRNYADGDDLRHLDWNVLARLQTPVIRTYRDEQDLAVYVMVDGSASMEFGDPSKLESALKFALAFGYVALFGGDAVFPISLPLSRKPQPLRGRSNFSKLKHWANSFQISDSNKPLSTALREFSGLGLRPGLIVLLSDGFDPEVEKELTLLGSQGHELLFLQILSDEDESPEIEGDVKLIDCESSGSVELTATSAILTRYEANLREHCSRLRTASERFGGKFETFNTKTSLHDALAGTLRRKGWLSS